VESEAGTGSRSSGIPCRAIAVADFQRPKRVAAGPFHQLGKAAPAQADTETALEQLPDRRAIQWLQPQDLQPLAQCRLEQVGSVVLRCQAHRGR